jgi:murein DD-endopeptidase MepM/ murein hydrolase activator NlpD
MAQASTRRPETRKHNRSIAAGVLVTLLAAAPVAVAAAVGDPSTVSTRAAGVADVHIKERLAAERAARLKSAASKVASSDSLTWPVHGAVTGQFHEQRSGHIHQGIDIPLPEGTPIEAAAAGRVVMREEQDGYGNYTCIAHVAVLTCYGHQSRFGTKLGAVVRRGQTIGFVGHTGSAPVDHLHFEVRRGTEPWGTPVDPAKYLPGQ